MYKLIGNDTFRRIDGVWYKMTYTWSRCSDIDLVKLEQDCNKKRKELTQLEIN